MCIIKGHLGGADGADMSSVVFKEKIVGYYVFISSPEPKAHR